MAFHTYECDICETRLDRWLLSGDDYNTQNCEGCGTRLRKVITGCSIAPIRGEGMTPGRTVAEATTTYQGLPTAYVSTLTADDRAKAKQATESIRSGRIRHK